MLGMESPNSYYSKAIWKREAQKRTVRTHMIYYDSFLMWKLCPFIDAELIIKKYLFWSFDFLHAKLLPQKSLMYHEN